MRQKSLDLKQFWTRWKKIWTSHICRNCQSLFWCQSHRSRRDHMNRPFTSIWYLYADRILLYQLLLTHTSITISRQLRGLSLWTCRHGFTVVIRCRGSPDIPRLIFAIIPFFLLLQAALRRCPSSSSVMVKSAGVAERLLALLRLLLPLRQALPLALFSCLLLCGIASSVANPAACG